MSESDNASIPAIQSAAINLGTAGRDTDMALECWDDNNWADALVWINNAISQLESARAKIVAHKDLQSREPNNQ